MNQIQHDREMELYNHFPNMKDYVVHMTTEYMELHLPDDAQLDFRSEQFKRFFEAWEVLDNSNQCLDSICTPNRHSIIMPTKVQVRLFFNQFVRAEMFGMYKCNFSFHPVPDEEQEPITEDVEATIVDSKLLNHE